MRATDLLGRVVDEAEAGQLPVLIEEWLAENDERHWLARALRIDRALLVEHPELVVPCVLRRTLWLGGERTFERRPELPVGAEGLLDLAMRWDGVWGGKQRYLRTLRSPRVPLDGGVLEEYRSSAQGHLWITAEHVGIGEVAWQRASGRRVKLVPPAKPDPPHATFVLGDVSIKATLEANDDGETAEYYTCAETATNQQLWAHAGECTGAARIGDQIWIKTREGHRIHARAGRVLGEGGLVGAGMVAAPDGVIATREHDVIRVWDATAIRTPSVLPGYLRGLVAIAPDGERMVVGRIVVDPRTGREIAEVAFRALGGWLEGGPPANCRALCNEVIAEISPLGFFMWDSAYPSMVIASNPRHRASTNECVAWDPRGVLHAIFDGKTVTVFHNHTFDVIQQQAHVAETWHTKLAFSRDGSTLWISTKDAAPIELVIEGEVAPAYLPRSAEIHDGIVDLDGLRLPIDDPRAVVSDDGSVIAGWSTHYVRS